jgi:probable O-glycosylation ligase (exosortase A-associated)
VNAAADDRNNGSLDDYKKWFFFTIIYLVVDYGRPQDLFSPIGALKPGMIAILILTGFLIFKGKLKDASSKQTRLLWFFIILLGTYVPFAMNNFFAYKTTESMVLFMPFILSTIICINSIEYLKKFIFILILLMIYISAYSLLHGGVGSGNYFQDENDLSLYINMYLPFCFFFLSTEKEKLRKMVYGVGLLSGVLAIVVSFSRGGFVGLICTAVIGWLYSPKKLKSLAIIGLLGVMIYAFAGDAYWARIATAKDTDEGTAIERIESWKSGWNMFLANPLGVGGNNFMVRFPEYQTEYFQKGMYGRQAHSLWFTLIPEVGIFGITIYFSLLYYNVKDLFYLRRIREIDSADSKYFQALSAAFMASLAGYFSSGAFLSVLYYPHYWYMTGIIVASAKIARQFEVNIDRRFVS